MSASEPLLKTQQVARALGVGESTVKRWVNAGRLQAGRTVGGHRLIPLSDVLRIARRQNLPESKIEQLVALTVTSHQPGSKQIVDLLLSALFAGESAEARRILLSAWRDRTSAAELIDGVIEPVMAAIGHQWISSQIGIDQEHEATQLVISVMTEIAQQIRDRVPTEFQSETPRALGATPSGDNYVLANLSCELVLRDLGWDVVNLGSNLPLQALANAVQRHQPRLVWMSLNSLDDHDAFIIELASLCKTLHREGTSVIVGGQAVTPELRAQLNCISFGENMSHLADYARGLTARRRARPAMNRLSDYESTDRLDSLIPRG